ncbi:MAG: hypothetical protein WCB15_30470, partial [Desulfobacterales bacterium]
DVLKQAEIAVKTPGDFKKTADAILKYADDEKWLSDTKLQLEKERLIKTFIPNLSSGNRSASSAQP